jgi:iron complex transport system permease protein
VAISIYETKLRNFLTFFSLLTLLNIALFVAHISIGPAMLDPVLVFQTLFGLSPNPQKVVVDVVSLRLTRALAALLSGAALALAGLLMQTITRNPLADPYIFGLSSTALTFVALGFIFAPSLMVYRHYIIAVAFLGALSGYILTALLSRLGGGSDISMVLAGIAVASLFSGLSHVLLYIVQSMLRSPYVYFLLGSTTTVRQREIPLMTELLAVSTFASLLLIKPLNAYLYGDSYAKQLGFEPKYIRYLGAFIASLLTAVIVSYVGIVGFVGLAAPHIARFLVGSNHLFSMPITILVGASIALSADIIVKLISMYVGAVAELPLGVVTSIIGAPFLAYLIIKRLRE